MAGAASLQGLLEEATCSICLEYFQDPVLIPECGHNFCRGCLSSSWGTSESEASCPQCRQTFAPRNVLPNRQLERMVEEAKRCGGLWGEEGGNLCPKHREPLKLFCKDDETLICLFCMVSKEHKGHSVIPAEEAFPEYQIKVGDCLKVQREQKLKIATYEGDTVQKMLDHLKEVKKDVVAEFRELQLWLEAQENLLLTRMEQTEKDIMARKKKGLVEHTVELCSLDHLIQEIEDKLQQPASKLLQDIGSILKKYQAKETYENPVDLLLEPKWVIWDYSDLPALLKRIMKNLRDTLESGLQLQQENIILDRDRIHPPGLDISEDRKSITGVMKVEAICHAPNFRKFGFDRYVRGCQKFSTGRHFWEVIVGDATGWDIGVIDNWVTSWIIQESKGKYMAISQSGHSNVVVTERPTRIRLSLNCEEGKLKFFDARTAALLHTFSDASLVGKILQPCFSMFQGACITLP